MIHTRMRLLKATVAEIALLALATATYLQHPLFGQMPQGAFLNQIDTPMLTTDDPRARAPMPTHVRRFSIPPHRKMPGR
jgi:hypothetical protein